MLRPAIGETVVGDAAGARLGGGRARRPSAIVLVGGSSRIPLVSEMLSAAFGRPLAMDNHPKHDVALGAAIRGTPAAQPAAARPAPTPARRRPAVAAAAAGRGDGPMTGALTGPTTGPTADRSAATATPATAPRRRHRETPRYRRDPGAAPAVPPGPSPDGARPRPSAR